MLTLAQVEQATLFALYEEATRGESKVQTDGIQKRMGLRVTIRQVELALQKLLDDGVVQSTLSPASGYWYAISRQGYLTVEKAIGSIGSIHSVFARDGLRASLDAIVAKKAATEPTGERAGSIPASDRLVTINDNAPEYIAARDAIDELVIKLRSINDPALRDAEVDQAILEIQAGRLLMEAPQLSVPLAERLMVGALRFLARKLATHAFETAIGTTLTAVLTWLKLAGAFQ